MTENARRELLALRDPLCSAEIAASLLERDTLGASRNLATSIRAAISDVDDRIELLARELATAGAEANPVHRVAEAFEDVIARVAPALAARGVNVQCSPGDPDARCDEPALLRRTLLALLRCASSAQCETGFNVGWLQRESKLGVRVALAANSAPSAAALEELQRFVERERIELAQSSEAEAIEIVAWLPVTSGSAQ